MRVRPLVSSSHSHSSPRDIRKQCTMSHRCCLQERRCPAGGHPALLGRAGAAARLFCGGFGSDSELVSYTRSGGLRDAH